MAKLTADENRELSTLDNLLDDGVTLSPEQKSRHFNLILQEREEREWQREIRGYQHDSRDDE